MGLVTELTIGNKTENTLTFVTSKNKAIFSTGFMLSGIVLALMWYSTRETFQIMLANKHWLDLLIVNSFYAATLLYPFIGLCFLGYHRELQLNRDDPRLQITTLFFKIPLRRLQINEEALKTVRLEHILKGKNIAHDQAHLERYRNSGYWQVVADDRSNNRRFVIDRNTDEREMQSLKNHIETFLRSSPEGPSKLT